MDWLCWSWNSNTLATSCEELTHWKRPSCWEGLGAGGEGDDRRWDGWMSSLTRWMSLSELQESAMDREAWRAVIHGVAKSWIQLSDWTELNWLIHFSILAWRIPWTEEQPGGLQSMGSQRVGHNWVTNTHTQIHTLTLFFVIEFSVFIEAAF